MIFPNFSNKMCNTCELLKKKETKLLYEDDMVFAILPEEPAVAGHIKVFTKKHFTTIREVPNDIAEHLFFSASYASTAVFEYLGAQGTNIIINEGFNNQHVCADVLPRKMDDGLKLQWEPKQLSEQEMDEALKQLSDKAFFVGKKTEEEKTPIIKEGKKKKIKYDKENYQIKHLIRVP